MAAPDFSLALLAVYGGGPGTLPDGRPSGIYKTLRADPVTVTPLGLLGDHQADQRVHGGPDKAIHLFPRENYRALATAFPHLAAHLVPGVLGENLSTEGGAQEAVCIGDRYAWGEALLELSQPRHPCWKIDARLEQEGVAAYVAEQGLTGWYFRVLREGRAPAQGRLTLVARPNPSATLTALADLMGRHRPSIGTLEAAARWPGLAGDVARRLRQRADWLGRQAENG